MADKLIEEPVSHDYPLGFVEELGETKLWAEIFSKGKHTDSSGTDDDWDDSDLDEIETKYAEQVKTKPAPLVLGHPSELSSGAPAFGWIEEVKHVGDKLVAKFGQLNKVFVDALKNGSYKTRSISLYPDNTIRHCGFLGANQPAIPGLQPLSFEENKPYQSYSFTEVSMADKVIELATTMTAPVAENIEEIKKENNFFKKVFDLFKVDVKNFSAPVNGDITNKETIDKEDGVELVAEKPEAGDTTNAKTVETETKDPKVAEANVVKGKETVAAELNEANKLADENLKLKAKVTALESELEGLRKATQTAATTSNNRAFCETLVSEGKMRPADVDEILANLEARSYVDGSRNFSEEQPDSSVNQYKDYLSKQPKIVEFGEILPDLPPKDALRPVPQAPEDLDSYIETNIKEKMKLNPNVSYDDAMKQAFTECAMEHPQLMAEYARAASCR